MSNDQANAVDGDAAFLDALGGGEPEEKKKENAPAVTFNEQGEEIPQEELSKPEEEQPQEEEPDVSQVFKLTIKNDAGQDEEKDVTLDELAKGYMLQADYTRKTQELATQKQEVVAQYHQDLTKIQQSAVEQINQLQELVLSQAAPELASVDWEKLSVTDPAEFVRLQAKQQKLQTMWQGMEQQKAQFVQQREQQIGQQVEQALKHSDEVLTKAIPGFDATKAATLLQDIEKSVGWKPSDIRLAAKAMAEAGMRPETIGQVLLMAHKAIQFDQLDTKLKNTKTAVLTKVAAAPKVIRPAAPQPRQTENKAALERLRKNGRGEDFMKFL
jgi:hypothetical protein